MAIYNIWTSRREIGTYCTCTNASPMLKTSTELDFSLSLYLHPYFVYASSEGSTDCEQMRRIAWPFDAHRCYVHVSKSHHESLALLLLYMHYWTVKIVSEYDQEIPQSQTADNPVAPRGRAAQPSRDTRKTN